MLRLIVPTLSLLLALPLAAQAASKQEFELNKMLQKVAKESSVGTPRECVSTNNDVVRPDVFAGQARSHKGHSGARIQLGVRHHSALLFSMDDSVIE